MGGRTVTPHMREPSHRAQHFHLLAEVRNSEIRAMAIRVRMITAVSIELAQWMSEAISKLDLYRQLHRRKGGNRFWTDRWDKP